MLQSKVDDIESRLQHDTQLEKGLTRSKLGGEAGC